MDSGTDAYTYASSDEYDGLILDIMMPGMDGVTLLTKLRAEKKSSWVDFSAGSVADGTETIDEAAERLLLLVIEVASGKKTRAEEAGYREIAIFKDGVTL